MILPTPIFLRAEARLMRRMTRLCFNIFIEIINHTIEILSRDRRYDRV